MPEEALIQINHWHEYMRVGMVASVTWFSFCISIMLGSYAWAFYAGTKIKESHNKLASWCYALPMAIVSIISILQLQLGIDACAAILVDYDEMPLHMQNVVEQYGSVRDADQLFAAPVIPNGYIVAIDLMRDTLVRSKCFAWILVFGSFVWTAIDLVMCFRVKIHMWWLRLRYR